MLVGTHPPGHAVHGDAPLLTLCGVAVHVNAIEHDVGRRGVGAIVAKLDERLEARVDRAVELDEAEAIAVRPWLGVQQRCRLIRAALADQAVEVVTIPLAGKSSIADHMVIASGRSSRQVASMANKLADKIKQQFGRPVRIEGLPVADWVLIDADDVIVHLFRPEVRTFYNLERMWAFGDEAQPLRSAGA